ncbi:MAG: sorbosone dehydrogenase family protein [Acidobacteriota bacterium]
MKHLRWVPFYASVLLAAAVLVQAAKTDGWNILTGSNAWADAAKVAPGTSRRITPKDLPAPGSGTPNQKKGTRPPGAMPKAPAGFTVGIYAEMGTNAPRQIRTAPNGDIFVMNTGQGNITVFRGMTAAGKPMLTETFASGLSAPFGVSFYPAGNDPQWVYVGNTGSVVRFPYKSGDMKARGPAETIVEKLPTGGHSTRDVVFSRDGRSMFVAVGSASNIDDPDTHASEFHRANILEYAPDGKFIGVYASGIRNPVGLAVNPTTGEVWTSINERDNLGDNLVPDYITHVERGGFYGWPYFYIGGNPDSRLMGAHPELKSKVIVPDVLVQAHSASLGMAFYTGTQFPAEYRGDAFAAEHGSWNRSVHSGHEVVRVPLDNGKSNGVYQDFLTGFVDASGEPWGRPVGVTTAPDGSLLVTDDATRVIWRVSYTGNGK